MSDLSVSQTNGFHYRGRIVNLVIFLAVIVLGALYVAFHLANGLGSIKETSALSFLLLGVALLIAFGFEFVNGFHDTANAVTTVIYTNSLAPHLAVVWSGEWNFWACCFQAAPLHLESSSCCP
jgi:PiT family inorganic phosphate transporter